VDQLADRDRYIDELETLLAEKDRLIAQLQTDVAWERTRVRQLESSAVPPGAATVIRPDGKTAEIVHAISRQSQEVSPPLSHGHPDYAAWAKEIASRIDGGLSVMELHWLLDDNAAHLDAYETAFPGAGVALEDRISRRIAELD
jgi:uncharacterized coiled-coil protein SlyX